MDFCKKLPLMLCFSIFLQQCALATNLLCRDENGQPVDWYVAIKLPRLKMSKDIKIRSGEAYVFITSNAADKNWTVSTRTVSDPDSMMGNTLRPLYDNEVSSFAHIMYNDEPPHGNTTFTLGHTKGVVVGDDQSGFWLIHSVPHFPPEASSNAYSYPNTGLVYGQSFLCISVSANALEIIGHQLLYNEPDIYDAKVPESLRTVLPNIAKAAQGDTIHTAPWYNSAKFLSASGQTFISYAKSKNFGKDLYADWVAQNLTASLYVETWNHGAKMQSECKKLYKVQNVDSLRVSDVSFTASNDHSKWAVSTDDKKPWVCVGDINRVEHQKQRGGGTACFENDDLYNTFFNAVTSTDVCPSEGERE